jgi:hypothetical protein
LGENTDKKGLGKLSLPALFLYSFTKVEEIGFSIPFSSGRMPQPNPVVALPIEANGILHFFLSLKKHQYL